MKNGDESLVLTKPCERRLELQCFVDRLADEVLDDVLAPGPKGATAKTTRETLDAGKAHAMDFGAVAIEHRHTGVDQNLADLDLLAGFEIMVAKNAHYRDLHPRSDLARERPRLVCESVIGQIPAEDKDVGALGDLCEQRLQGTLYRVPPVMKVTDCSDSDGTCVSDCHSRGLEQRQCQSRSLNLYNGAMARGFDSKFIEAQQDEATRDKKLNPALTPEQRELASKRAALELSRSRARADLSRATATAHRKMLEEAIAALESQLADLPPA